MVAKSTTRSAKPEAEAKSSPAITAVQQQIEATVKALIDRQGAVTAMMMEVNRDNLSTMVELSQTASTGFREMALQFSEFSRQRMEEVSSATQSLGDVKAPADFLAVQADQVKSASDAMIGEMNALADMTTTMTMTMMATLQSRSRRALDRLQNAVVDAPAASDLPAGA